jgi:Transcriptional regulatory protein, C terminal
MLKSALVILVLLVSLSLASFDWLIGVVGGAEKPVFSEKANLALRRTAHHLLKSAGDSTSRIEPVWQVNERTFSVRLTNTLDYDRLPKLLEESLKTHHIEQSYDVSVLNCKDGELELGYNYLDYKNNNEVPCGGRNRAKGCYDLRVTFSGLPPTSSTKPYWLLPVLGLLLVGVGVWRYGKTTPRQAEPTAAFEPSEQLVFGNSSFHFANQILLSAGTQHNLTYREAKLLRLFVNHPNQLLEREAIMKAIWEDEGITVGRSLDVFVSRLRKLIQADPSVQIVTVHGVGYKLQIQES